ncbi:MAG TPA: YraN family protein [Candidatus Acidoferrales bacterium]|nr:YraN family protein [Candidatus Acidoferrales bacterium]
MGFAQRRGRAGEALAAAYLEMLGCRLVARNARLAGVEVDLVVDDGASRVLVEVRLRSRPDFGGAAATVDARKRQRLVRAAMALDPDGDRPLRIDVIAVDVHPDGASLTHYRNAVTG